MFSSRHCFFPTLLLFTPSFLPSPVGWSSTTPLLPQNLIHSSLTARRQLNPATHTCWSLQDTRDFFLLLKQEDPVQRQLSKTYETSRPWPSSVSEDLLQLITLPTCRYPPYIISAPPLIPNTCPSNYFPLQPTRSLPVTVIRPACILTSSRPLPFSRPRDFRRTVPLLDLSLVRAAGVLSSPALLPTVWQTNRFRAPIFSRLPATATAAEAILLPDSSKSQKRTNMR